MAEKAKLPSFKDLVVESFELLKEKIGRLIVIGIGGFLIELLVLLVPVVIAIAVFFGFSGINFAHFSADAVSQVPLWVKISVPLFLIIGYVGACIVGMMAYISGYLALDTKESSFSYFSKNSIGKVWPLFITMLIQALLVLGGFFVFIIPVFFMAFFFYFVVPVIIFEKKSFIQALDRSASMVRQNFGDLFIKLLIPFLIQAFVQYVLMSFNTKEAGAASTMQFPLMIFNMVWSALTFAYGFVLYKYTVKISKNEKSGVLPWLAIVSIIGYLLFGAIVYAAVLFVKSPAGQTMLQEMNNKVMESAKAEDSDMLLLDESPVPWATAIPAPAKQLPTKLPAKNLPR